MAGGDGFRGNGANMKKMFIITKKQAEMIRSEAHERNVSMSQIIRELLNDRYGDKK